MRRHLGAAAAAPLSASERAALGANGHDRDAAGRCLMPVPAGAPQLPAFKWQNRPCDHRYEYRDAAGALLGYVLRWDASAGGRKNFWPVTLWEDERGKRQWQRKMWPEPRPLFGLDRLAQAPDALVIIVEGEKKVQARATGPLAHGFEWSPRKTVAVAWPSGAEAADRADFSVLAGRDVVVVPDADGPGSKAAERLTEILHQAGVRRLQRWTPPPGLPEGWDIADQVPAHLDPDAVVASILNAPECRPPRLVKTAAEFLEGFVPPDYVVDGILRRGFLYALTAMTGGGKTAIGLDLAEAASNRTRRRKFGMHDVEHVGVLYLAAENADDVRMRLIGMEQQMGFDRTDLDLLVIDKVFPLEENMERICKEVAEFGVNIGLVIVDTSAAMFAGDDDNNNIQMLAHAKLQRRLCDELPGRPTVLSLVHPPKHVGSPEDLLPRGGGAYLNEIDGNLTAWAHGERMTRLHFTGKFRGPDFEPIEFQLQTVETTALVDARGRLLPTVMAVALDLEALAEQETKTRLRDNRLLLAISEDPDGSIAKWAAACGWMLRAKPGEAPKPNKNLAFRVVQRLMQDGLLKKKGRGYSITAAGEDAAKAARKTADFVPNDDRTAGTQDDAAEMAP